MSRKFNGKGETMNTKFFENLRVILNANTVFATRAKLLNTVILKFRKGESETLTLQTLDKLAASIGLSLDLRFVDENGNVVDFDEVRKRIEAVAGAAAKKEEAEKAADTLAVIAGASTAAATTEAAAESKTESKTKSKSKVKAEDDEPMEVQIGSSNVNNTSVVTADEHGLAASSNEVEIDLAEIFG